MALQPTTEPVLAPQPIVGQEYCELSDGSRTTIHYAKYARTAFKARVVSFEEPTLLLEWCIENDCFDAINGGFFLRDTGQALGELCIQGERLPFVPFAGEHGSKRGSLHIDEDGNVRLGLRKQLPPETQGDILQAGPILVRDGEVTHRTFWADPERFSRTAEQHDADITAERYPRAAIGCDKHHIWTVTADGRDPRDAGLYLHELADIMARMGVESALNLDGGSSSTHISQGALINRPRSDLQESPVGFPVYNAIVLEPRTEPPILREA